MANQDAQTLTESPAAIDVAETANDAINQLKALADRTLRQEFQEIAEAARHGEVGLRIERHNTMANLVGTAACLARDLADVLLKVATDNEPHSVMGGAAPARIREAEIRLETLRDLSR